MTGLERMTATLAALISGVAAAQVTVNFASLQNYTPPYNALLVDSPYTESGFVFRTSATDFPAVLFQPLDSDYFKLAAIPSMTSPVFLTQAADVPLISVARADGQAFTLQSLLLNSYSSSFLARGLRPDGSIVGSWHEQVDGLNTIQFTDLVGVVRVWFEPSTSDGFTFTSLTFSDIVPASVPALPALRTLDFEALAVSDAAEHEFRAYFEKGFVLNTDIENASPVGFRYLGAQHPDYQGSTTLRTAELSLPSSSSHTRIQRDSLEPFTLVSIDVHRRAVPYSIDNIPVVFRGQRSDGSIVTESVLVPPGSDIPGEFARLSLTQMTDIVVGDWDSGGWYEFDNVIVQIPAPACVADFNNNGSVTVQDIFDFLSAYFTADPRADINQIGGVTVQDIFDYLAVYFTGCP